MSTPEKQLPVRQSDPDAAPLRFVTAASLFDGHDAAINIMRRLIQDQGTEVIHLGHNRGVEEIVRAALQEDADAIAVSSYQGGHMEFFRYMVDMLRENGASHIRIFGGGGGTITPEEAQELHEYGVERIYHPDEGMEMGLVTMIEDVVARAERNRRAPQAPKEISLEDENAIASMLTAIESGVLTEAELDRLRKEWQMAAAAVPVVGITGTGGSGKSSVIDELLNRFLQCFPEMHIAVLAIDPTRRRTGGALLGDRIRINSLRNPNTYMRSMATRRQHLSTSAVLVDCIAFLKSVGFDLILVETAGIGQSDSEIVDLVDLPAYVMTSDYGAASQLEKIDMLDYAEMVVLNKYDRRGAEDALRDVRKQWQRNHKAFDMPLDEAPVYPSIASQVNDPGMNWVFYNLCRMLVEKLGLDESRWTPEIDVEVKEPRATALIPATRVRYLSEIANVGRDANESIERQAEAASRAQTCYEALADLSSRVLRRTRPGGRRRPHAANPAAALPGSPIGAFPRRRPSAEGLARKGSRGARRYLHLHRARPGDRWQRLQ